MRLVHMRDRDCGTNRSPINYLHKILVWKCSGPRESIGELLHALTLRSIFKGNTDECLKGKAHGTDGKQWQAFSPAVLSAGAANQISK